MSVLQRMLAAAGGASGVTNPRDWLINLVHAGLTSSAGVSVNPTSALGLSAYYGCIRNISEDVGKLPFKVYRRLARGKEPVQDHPLYRVLHDSPNPHITSQHFRELLTGWALGWGNGIAEIIPRGNSRFELYPIPPDHLMDVEVDESTQAKTYLINRDDGTVVRLGEDRVFDIRGFGGLKQGYSAARYGKESLGRAMAAQEYSARFFGEGTTGAGIFSFDGAISPDLKKNVVENWPSGLPNAHKPMFLSQGAKWQPMGIPPEDAQMIETCKFSVIDVCRWFRMPPHMIGDLERATFSNIEHQSIEYVVETLQPWLVRWEQEVRRKLVQEDDVFAEHLVTGLLRGDTPSRYQAYGQGIKDGWMTRNEVRELENMNPATGLDEFLEPLNMARASDPREGGGQNVEDVEDEEPDDRAEAVAALRPVFIAAAQRVLGKLSNAVKRAAGKFRLATGFEEWAVGFFPAQRQFIIDAFAPAVQALEHAMGNGRFSQVSGLLYQHATQWCEEARKQAAEAFKTGSWRELSDDWRELMPPERADLLLELLWPMGCDHDST